MEKKESKKNGKLVLTDDPLHTKNINFLEEILNSAEGRKYLNAIQYASIGGNFGYFTNSNTEPLNKHLPGGRVIRMRYTVQKIQERYNQLKKSA